MCVYTALLWFLYVPLVVYKPLTSLVYLCFCLPVSPTTAVQVCHLATVPELCTHDRERMRLVKLR